MVRTRTCRRETAIQICDLYRVLGSSEESLDSQMLLDPFEKSSTCQRQRYSSVIVNAGKTKLL